MACVAGTIFASPGAEQVRTCLSHRLPHESEGILVLATNYTGDVLNFGMGVEKARALGKKVEMVVVGDDVGVGREKSGKVGRRGLSGTALVVKICGALAEQGARLEDCAKVARLCVNNMVSLGASLSRVHVPGKDVEEARAEEERLGPGLVEIGMGVHNEPGCEKVSTDLPGLIKIMLGQMLDQSDKDRAYVKIDKGEGVMLCINNYGGLSNLELGAVTNEVVSQLERSYGLKPQRIVQGTLFGSLNGPGFIITILKLTDTGLGHGKQIVNLIDAPVNAVGWPRCVSGDVWETKYPAVPEKMDDEEKTKSSNLTGDYSLVSRVKWLTYIYVVDPKQVKSILEPALKKVIAEEATITKYDTIVGDGDCGIGLKRGAEATLLSLSQFSSTDAMDLFATICPTIEKSMDGTSGALFAIFLNSLASNVRKLDTTSRAALTTQVWAKALKLSLEDLGAYTQAQPGDRTLMDALVPFVDVLSRSGDVKKAADAARIGAEKTKGMKPSLGRSVYVGGSGFEEVPDPGAYGLSVFLDEIANAC